jgi:Tfp pilus assembly protein PilE
MFTVLELLAVVIVVGIGWFLVGWSIGYKQGVKDGYHRGKAAAMRWATERVRNS